MNKIKLLLVAAVILPGIFFVVDSARADCYDTIRKINCHSGEYMYRSGIRWTCNGSEFGDWIYPDGYDESNDCAYLREQEAEEAKPKCSDGEIMFSDGSCHSLSALCGNDPHIYYSESSGECGCHSDYYYKDEKCMTQDEYWADEFGDWDDVDNDSDNGNEINCALDELVVDGVCTTVSDLCGFDPYITYDAGSDSCYCTEGMALIKQNGANVCQKPAEVEIDVRVSGDGDQPPLLANGQSELVLNIKATNDADGGAVPLTFDIRQTTTEPNGKIMSVSGSASAGYVVRYSAPEMDFVESGQPQDWLYMRYKLNGKDGYETYIIKLYTGRLSPFKITHPGFQAYTSDIVLDANQVEIFVYITGNDSSDKVPVVGAKVEYENFFPETTDKNGKAILQAKSETYSKDSSYKEFRLELGDRSIGGMNKCRQFLSELDIPNKNASDFVDKFPIYLAEAANDNEINGLLNLLDSTKNALFILNEGQMYDKHIAEEIGDTLGDIIWDTVSLSMDIIDVFGTTNKTMQEATAKGFFDWSPKELKAEREAWDDFLNMVVHRLYAKLRKQVYQETGSNPRYFTGIVDSVIKKLLSEDFKNDFKLIDVKKNITEIYQSGHKEMIVKILEQIGEKLKKRNFSHYDFLTESRIAGARSDFQMFVSRYQFDANFSYSMAERKAWTNWFRQSVLKGIDIVYGSTLVGEIASGIDKTIGAVDIALNGVNYKQWLELYEENQKMMKELVGALLDIQLTQATSPPTGLVLAETAWAESGDELGMMYDNGVALDNPDRQRVIDYYDHKQDRDFYVATVKMLDVFLPYADDDEEFKEIYNDFQEKLANVKEVIAQEEPKIKKLDILKPKGQSVPGWVMWMLGVVGLGAVVLIIKRVRGGAENPSSLKTLRAKGVQISQKVVKQKKPKSLFGKILKIIVIIIGVIVLLMVVGFVGELLSGVTK